LIIAPILNEISYYIQKVARTVPQSVARDRSRGALSTGASPDPRNRIMQNLPIESKKLLGYTIYPEFVVKTSEQTVLPPDEVQGHDAV
jgi:hypothetical protein